MREVGVRVGWEENINNVRACDATYREHLVVLKDLIWLFHNLAAYRMKSNLREPNYEIKE